MRHRGSGVSEPEARRLAAALVSSRVGLVTELAAQQRGPEEPVPPYLYTATLAHFDFRGAPRRERLNAGKGRTEAEARLSALGEAVERYSAYHWDPTRVWTGATEDGAITPADCVLYSEAQYEAGLRYHRWSAQSEISWMRGVELPSGAPVAVPAGLVYLVGALPRAEDHVTAITSNGLAAGPDLTRAILGGLYELVERDALMITWMNRLPATAIESPENGCYAASVVRHYRRFDVAVRLFRLATDQVPHVILAVADNPPGDGPARVIGMGCDIDPVAAVDKAVFEMCQARPSEAVRFRETDPGARLARYEDVHDIDDHPGFHSLRAHAGEFDFLSASGQRVELGALDRSGAREGEPALQAVVEGLRRSGARVAYAEITAPDVASVGGMHVVRAFATGLQPIHFGFGEGRFGGRRLFEAPLAWGLAQRCLSEGELNACPHPLA
jgi:ribosomal protein S12 methylthiotransferase accessory factor